MHAVFAVEPNAINCWTNFRYLIEKFGFPNGALIARYPKSWMRLVIEACDANGVGDIERSKIVEKLSQAKHDRMLNKSFPFNGGEWRSNAVDSEVVNLFDALVLTNDEPLAHAYSIDDLPEEVFHDRREVQVPRDAESLASAASCLFVDSRAITLIDPYLKPSRACTNLLNAFVDASAGVGRGITRVVVHMAYSIDSSDCADVIAEYKRFMGQKIANGLSLQVNRWNDHAMDFDFHARYLLTDQAGLRYDRGFIEPSDHDERAKLTDVVCLERGTIKDLLTQHNVDDSTGAIVDVIEVV